MTDYAPPVSRLLDLELGPDMTSRKWPHYLELGIGPEQIPDLIRMATDETLYDADSESAEVLAPIHAWRTLGQLRAEAAIAPLISLFAKRESDELDNWDEWISEELPIVFGMIGPAAIPDLAAYLADASKGSYERASALHCLEAIGKQYPEARAECETRLTQQLVAFRDNEPELNGFLIASLIKLDVVEAAPWMEEAFAANAVDELISGDWDDVQMDLGLQPPPELELFPPFPFASPPPELELFPPPPSASPPPGRAKSTSATRKAKAKKRKQQKESRRKNRKQK